MKTQKNVLFVAFDSEEKGLLGSKAMVEAIPKDQIPQYCAMLNIDSFGMAAPFALEGSSSKKLMKLAESVSKNMKIPFVTIRIEGADSDSTSFIKAKIPAVTLSGLSNKWQSVLHTSLDQTDMVNPVSVYLGYRLALSMWGRLDNSDCAAFR
jgi:Zn-dependent M28 family amino/carboxypeptidase